MSAAKYLHVSPWFPDWLAWAGQRTWCAIDFETMDRRRDSACSVALVRVVGGRIAQTAHALCKPPRQNEDNTPIHGITWSDVQHRPPLSDVWNSLREVWDGCAHLVAHNVGFDQSVLTTTLESQGQQAPEVPWFDTVALSKAIWPEWKQAGGYGLGTITTKLGIVHRHHDALSDALACAKIVFAARELCRVQLGDFEDQWKAKYIERTGSPRALLELETSHLTSSQEGTITKLHCSRCESDDTQVSGPPRLTGPAIEAFARRHQICPPEQNRDLRDLHYRELGLLCAPTLEINPPVVSMPPREIAPVAKVAVPLSLPLLLEEGTPR